MRKLTIICFILIISQFELKAQGERYYHNIRTSTSHVVLTEWRVGEENVGEYYILEKIDSLNRVIELRLMRGDSLYQSDCYDHAIYRFEYFKDKIVQHNLDNESTYSAGIECGAPAKMIYFLSDSTIDSSLHFLDYEQYLDGDFELEPDFREHLEKEYEKNKNGIKGNADFIYGYFFSSVKYNGYLPVAKDISMNDYFYPFSEKANNSPFAIQNAEYLHMQKLE